MVIVFAITITVLFSFIGLKLYFHLWVSDVLKYICSCCPFNRQPRKMVKHTQTIPRFLQANCLNV